MSKCVHRLHPRRAACRYPARTRATINSSNAALVEPIEEKLLADGKIVAFAPIASASDEAAMMVKPRLLGVRAPRTPDRTRFPAWNETLAEMCEVSGGERRAAPASGRYLRLEGRSS